MATIIGLDCGKFKSLACSYDPHTTQARFATVPTDPDALRRSLRAERPDLVVFETCTLVGRVADLCDELGLSFVVANPMHEAWSWRWVPLALPVLCSVPALAEPVPPRSMPLDSATRPPSSQHLTGHVST